LDVLVKTDELEWSWGRLQNVKLQHRSVSQLKEYLDELGGCAYKYFLNRVVRAWDMPAAWFPQGLAVHEAAEYWELSNRGVTRAQVLEEYRRSYREHYKRMIENTPNLNYWFPSWKYLGWDDITRRAFKGEEQINKYLDYYQKHPYEVPWLTPKNELSIELRFDMILDGIKVIGYIDQIIWWVTDIPVHLSLRDIKTGKNPGDTLQLKVYDLAIEKEFGISIGVGDYFMAEKGKPTKPYDLTQMSELQVTELFGKMDAGVRAEDFEPSPSPEKCRMCSVRAACQFAE
jgi:putative RecB family exonuclease